jgi:hypothetical protein
MAAADHGWRLVRLAELLRALERHQDRALRTLYRLDPSMRPAFAVTLRAGQVDRFHREGIEIAQLVEQIDALLDALPEEESISVTYDDVRASAERLLRDSDTLDAGAVLLAAQMLDRAAGLPALAEGLRASGAYTSWGTTTIGELLGAFRGVSPQLVRRIATAARMAPGTQTAGCRRDEIAALAEQLDLHARG